MTGELPPYCFHVPPPTVAEGGQRDGPRVPEVVREVARRVGNPQTVELPWPRAQEQAMAGPDRRILAVTRTP